MVLKSFDNAIEPNFPVFGSIATFKRPLLRPLKCSNVLSKVTFLSLKNTPLNTHLSELINETKAEIVNLQNGIDVTAEFYSDTILTFDGIKAIKRGKLIHIYGSLQINQTFSPWAAYLFRTTNKNFYPNTTNKNNTRFIAYTNSGSACQFRFNDDGFISINGISSSTELAINFFYETI